MIERERVTDYPGRIKRRKSCRHFNLILPFHHSLSLSFIPIISCQLSPSVPHSSSHFKLITCSDFTLFNSHAVLYLSFVFNIVFSSLGLAFFLWRQISTLRPFTSFWIRFRFMVDFEKQFFYCMYLLE